VNSTPTSLLDLGVVGPADIAAAEDAVKSLLATAGDVLLVQAEAIVALEATARGLGGTGVSALNVVTGPYGALFGRWLASAGAVVTSLDVPFDRAVAVSEIAGALAGEHFDLVAVVHAEAATGSANPIDQIAPLVHAHGAVLVVDAVASIGGHRVSPDAWHADVVVVGAQKALAGPAGVSALAVSDRAWQLMEANPGAPRESILSLLDLRDGWLRTGRVAVTGTPSSLETSALGQALARVQSQGLPQVISRHRAAAAATRAGLRALGLTPWITDDRHAATVVTTVSTPAGLSVPALLASARAAGSRVIGPTPGALAGCTFRVNHTGRAADLDTVLPALGALATVLDQAASSAVAAAAAVWSAEAVTMAME
jgi:aspartate aminotransferase-like enzyme